MIANVFKVGQAESRYGLPEPQIEIEVSKNANFRVLRAAMHNLAAAVELETPPNDRWVVQTDVFSDTRGRVYLELSEATIEEAARGTSILRKCAG